MWGKAYDFHRHSGRMMLDSTMRMSNRAEVGLGMAGMFGLLILIGLVIMVVI